MSNQWFRSWHGAPTDPKWRTIAKRAEVPTSLVVSFIWALMDRASQSEDRGSFEGVDLETIADYLDCDETQLKRIVTQCNARNVSCNSRFVSWEKRQPKREDDSSTDRVRQFRERKKIQQLNEDETQCNAMKRNETLDKSRVDIEIDKSISNKKTPFQILSECLPAETAQEVIAHRKALKSPLTPGAAKGLAKSFVAYGNPIAAAEAMMAKGWKGFNPDWMQSAREGPASKTNGSGGYASLLLKSLEKTNVYGIEEAGTNKTLDIIPAVSKDERRNSSVDSGDLSGNPATILITNSYKRM